MYSLCHLFLPTEINIYERTANAGITQEIATLVLNEILRGNYTLFDIYPYLGEIENSTNENYENQKGTLIFINIEHTSNDWKNDKVSILQKIISKLQSEDLHISSHSENHIAFISDFD